MEKRIVITAESSQELESILSSLPSLPEKLGKLPLEIRQRLLHLFDSPSKVVSLDVDLRIASGTDECRIALQPSDGLRDLVAAVARQVDFLVVKNPHAITSI